MRCYVWILLSACGRIGFDAALHDAPAQPDASADASLGMFSPPSIVPSLFDPLAQDDTPTVTGDLLELYFESNRAGGVGGLDIWLSKRTSTADPWPQPVVVAQISTTFADTTPSVASDGLTIWLSSDRPGGIGMRDIWVSTRPTRAAAWSTPTRVPELSTTSDDRCAGTGSATLLVNVSSDAPGGFGLTDIWFATRASTTDPWSGLAPLPEIDTASRDSCGHIADGGRAFVFGSDRQSASTTMIFLATRTTTTAPFEMPVSLSELGAPPDDAITPWISDDLRYVVFASNRGGMREIYEAFR
jgi:hypothetical protein